MNIYTLLVALVLVTALLMRGYQQGNKKYVIVACLLLFAVYGLRDTYVIGNDAKSSYLHGFEKMADRTWQELLDSDSIVIALDTIHDPKELAIYHRGVNYTQ